MTSGEYLALAAELEAELRERVLGFWFPRAVDTRRGGFVQAFRPDGTPADHHGKSLVFQARMIWLTSEIAVRYPDLRSEYVAYAGHGLDFLERTLWDHDAGGLFWDVGAHDSPASQEKHVYGMAFAILAAAAAARATADGRALALAERTFDWLDAHAHDDAHGGYYEPLTREGAPIVSRAGWKDALGTPCGRKSMNTHIHLLEALSELCRATQRETHRRRLHETFALIRDRLTHPDGYLQLHFEMDWTPVPGHQSFGHDLEVAFLLHEAAETLAIPNDERTRVTARNMVDCALARGFDAAHGGFHYAGDATGEVVDRRKVWWVQAEALNGLLAMHERYGATTGRYFTAFRKTWRFIADHVSDRTHGEWWGYLGPGGELLHPRQPKGSTWKACYHNGRALCVSAAKLRRLA